MVEGAGFEPAKALPADLQSAPFGQLGNPSTEKTIYKKLFIMEPVEELESTTSRLQVECSTN